ncbi:hypothetical protein [uncultured Hyphomicrobium sp.]|jgi:hypothetical protein|uniref:hypothetical protein n=1 Tax=uncultured Hyphomicrobium sp. TaxID=194373 RepID=UPI0025DAE39C|nr:hypothetical protein [uncultured Hyphomicrobium sp.]
MKTITITKASPNHFVLDRVCHLQTDRIEIVRIPVISWKTIVGDDGTTEVQPVTYEKLSGLYDGEIEWPEGHVSNREGTIWKTFAEFEAEASSYERVGLGLLDYLLVTRDKLEAANAKRR